MKVVFSKTIKKKELGNISQDELQILLDYDKRGIFTVIKWENLPKNTRLIKIYTTSASWAKRIVYMIDMLSKDAFFLFYRDKNDSIWKNISIKNNAFKIKLQQYLDILYKDIAENNLEIYEVK